MDQLRRAACRFYAAWQKKGRERRVVTVLLGQKTAAGDYYCSSKQLESKVASKGYNSDPSSTANGSTGWAV